MNAALLLCATHLKRKPKILTNKTILNVMKNEKDIAAPKNIDDYMATLPEKQREVLESLRQTIKETAPKAEEVISYMMPAFKYHGVLVYFAAFKNHCSFFPGNGGLTESLKDELKDYKTSKGTISFTVDKPLPKELVKKIVLERMAQNETKVSKKKIAVKTNETDTVVEYMQKLEHPLKNEINAVRNIINGANDKISERIKWNAPSYYYKKDLVTFNPRLEKKVHLVFHNEAITHIKSVLLVGDYKDRRMAYFANMDEINTHKSELERIMNEYIAAIDEP